MGEKRFQKWRDQKTPKLKAMGLTDEQVEQVLDFLIDVLEDRARDAEWKNMGGAI